MRNFIVGVTLIGVGILTFSRGMTSYAGPQAGGTTQTAGLRVVGPSDRLVLPAPLATPSAENRSKNIGWPAGKTPTALPGFRVTAFATGLSSPRELYTLPNGDILVAESPRGGASGTTSRITLLRDADGDGKPEVREVLVDNLNRPHGMALIGNRLYIGNTDGVLMFPYQPGQTKITAQGERILDLPSGRGHYTRNLAPKPDGSKLYISVGSGSNVDEDGQDAKDPRRAAILEINPDGSGMRVFAGGLRNPVGLRFQPGTGTLWTVVNERDRLGDNLVPDIFTSVKEGAFYGWPYTYYGKNEDPRKKGERPDLVARAISPDYALGPHVAPLGLAFYTGTSFPAEYRNGAFVGMHGSWNRAQFNGYKVAFIPFQNNKPSGDPQDFLTGFVASTADSTVYGRPVGVTVMKDGSLLVADDGGDVVWRVAKQ